MKVTLDAGELPLLADAAADPGAVISVGVFDGVHLGHLSILEANLARSRALGARPTVVTFRQHPKAILLGRAPRTLTTLEHRLALFARVGIEHTVALRFDEQLSRTTAGQFVEGLFLKGLRARAFVLGFDSKFGQGRVGGTDFLLSLGLDVKVAPKVVLDERAVSSTAVREAVELGDLAMASRMLGRPVTLLGQVVPGQALGRRLGFPTANLDLHHELHPPNGVYACRVRVLPQVVVPGGESAAESGSGADREVKRASGVPRQGHPAVANIGLRPTLEGPPAQVPLVEVHLLDFDGDLYGRQLELEFVDQLRGERRFDGLDALQEQIALDVKAARVRLAGP